MRLRLLKIRPEPSRPSSAAGAILASLVASLAVVVALAYGGPARADGFVLIRNAKNTTTSLSAADIKAMAIGKKKTWPGGPLVLMVLPPVGSPELAWFSSTFCGVSDSALMAKIKQEVFKGELRKPVIAASAAELTQAVAADEGALGIVAAGAAASLPASVVMMTTK